jgi:hypothetical protein
VVPDAICCQFEVTLVPNPGHTVANVQPPPNAAGPGNTRALTHGADSAVLVTPRADELAQQVLAAHPHLDAAKDAHAVARYALLLAKVERVQMWLHEQPDEDFSDRETGAFHAAHEHLDRWEKRCEHAEHRLAIDPYTRSKLGLVQAQAFDLAQAMSAAAEQEGDRE